MISLDALHERLVAFEGLRDLTRGQLRVTGTKGIVHDHVRLEDHGLLVRAPRFSTWDMAPHDNLAYQAASFRRAQPSGHVPRLIGVLEPDDDLIFGALIVEEIRGHPPRLPDEFEPMARALARIHATPVPPEAERPPLVYHRDPVAGTLARIGTQTEALTRAEIPEASRAAIEDELEWARRFAVEVRGLEQPVCLVMTDTHPGNFLVTADDTAIFIDIEKAMYGSPAIDLAHASLYTSINWDPDCARDLGILDVARLYRTYLDEIDRGAAAAIRPWFTPMRRLTWLRTTTWAAGWLAGRELPDDVPVRIARWIEDRVRDFFTPATIDRIRDEWLGDEPLDMVL